MAAQAAFSAHGCRPMMHIVSRARFSFSSTTPLPCTTRASSSAAQNPLETVF